jgi:hypothetical protein
MRGEQARFHMVVSSGSYSHQARTIDVSDLLKQYHSTYQDAHSQACCNAGHTASSSVTNDASNTRKGTEDVGGIFVSLCRRKQ